MADLYKEYLAHVPTKWSGFTKGAVPPGRGGKTTFVQCLPRNASESADFERELEDDGAGRERRAMKARGPMGERWIREMAVVVAEDKLREENRDRAEKLDALLRHKHETYMARRERELIPPTINGQKMPTAYHAVQDQHPVAVHRYQAMLSAAGAVALAATTTKMNDYADTVQQKLEITAQKHYDKILVAARRAETDRREAIHDAFEAHEKKLHQSQHRCREIAVRCDEDRSEAAEAAEEKRRQTTLRLEAERQEREREAERVEKEREAKLKRMKDAVVQRETEFNARLLTQQQRAHEQLVLLESKRHHRVEQQLGAKAYKRAMERREMEREKQRQEGVQRSTRREAHLKALDESRGVALEELASTHRHREQRADSVLDRRWEERKDEIEVEMVRAHEPPRPFLPRPRHVPGFLDSSTAPSPVDRSLSPTRLRLETVPGRQMSPPPAEITDQLTLRRVAHAKAIHDAALARAEAERNAARALMDERNAMVASKQAADYHATQQRQRDAEERREQVRAAAVEREAARQMRVDAEAAARAAKVEKQLAELRSLRTEQSRHEANERDQRILDCMEEVNVTKRENMIQALADKTKRRMDFEAARAEARRIEDDAKAAALEERQRRIAASVGHAQQSKEAAAREARRKHDLKVNAAVADRESHLKGLQRKLQSESLARQQQVEAAEESFAAEQARLRDTLAAKEARKARALQDERQAQARERRQRGATLREHEDQVLSQHFEVLDDKREKTQSRLEYVAERAATSLDVRKSNAAQVAEVARQYATTPSPLKRESTDRLSFSTQRVIAVRR
jgi:hypothetical protein